MWPLLFLLLSSNLFAHTQVVSHRGACPLKDGDLVFIKSQSAQSTLLKLVTESEWTHVGMTFKTKNGWDVIEAVQPVQWTSLYSFVKRSNQYHFEIYRPLFAVDTDKVKAYAEEQLNKDYDLIFAWDQERWYCSELVWKAYEKSSQEQIGDLQKVGDLKVSDPHVLNEAQRRFQNYGMPFNAEAWMATEVITPVQMMKSDKIQKVLDHKNIQSLKDCLF